MHQIVSRRNTEIDLVISLFISGRFFTVEINDFEHGAVSRVSDT